MMMQLHFPASYVARPSDRPREGDVWEVWRGLGIVCIVAGGAECDGYLYPPAGPETSRDIAIRIARALNDAEAHGHRTTPKRDDVGG